MYPVSARFLEHIAGTHHALVQARLLTTTQFGANPTGMDLPILSGDVKLSATSDNKSTLEITVPGDYWADVQPYGAEVWVARGIDYGDTTHEMVPLGYFRIDDVEQESAPYGPVRLSCSDRISQLKQNRVLWPFQVPEGYTHRQLFERLVNGRLSVGAADTPEQTQAAMLIRDRFVLGQSIAEDWTWSGAPAIVGTYKDALLALYEVDGAIPAQTQAAILIDYRILCHAPINDDWSWDGMPAIVGTYHDELRALNAAAGSPEPTVWLQQYATANGGTQPTQTQAAGIIKARLESGLAINADWTWPDPPGIVTTYHAQILSQYPGSFSDRPTAITWLGSYVSSHGGASQPDPVTWLEVYIAAHGGYDTINSLGYAALIQGPAVPIIWNGYDPDRYFINGGPVVENSTYEFMSKLADSRGCVLRFDELGQLNIDIREPDPDSPPVYVIEPGRTGNLIRASRKAVRDGVYNIVVSYGSDIAAPTGYQLAYNNDPNSKLRWDSLFGAAPRYYASPLLRTPAQAADAAATVLSRYTGLPSTVGLWTLPNPAIRPQDAISAKITGLPETHIVDVVTIPLAISGAGPVEIATKTLNDVVAAEEPTDDGSGGTGGGGTTAPTAAQILQEKCFRITSTAENSTVNWWEQFSYLEDIGDGRGLTGGIFGATSATGDMLELVQNYTATKPGNVLAPFLPGLQTCANAGQGSSATSLANSNLGTPFKNAWATAAADTVFQTAQINYRNQVYWTPAYNAAIADGLSNLGLAIYYDTSINHGMGSPDENDGSFDDIRAATGATSPKNGGNEVTFLTEFLNEREAVLTSWGDAPADGRVPMFRALIIAAEFALAVPISWSVYGDPFTMTTDPLPYGYTPGGTGGGGTGGGGTTTWPNPGTAHNIGSAAGQNSFNLGVGFDGDATYGTAHKDFTRAQIEAGLVIPGYYELTADGKVLMSAHPGGGKTSANTEYARTEYRELERDGTTKMAFNPSDGDHYIKGRSAITGSMASAKPETVIAQYHDASDDTVMIHVHDALVRVKIRGTITATLEAAWNHQPKDWKLEVTGGGKVNVYWGDLTTPAYTTTTFVGNTAGWYGKCGDYMQWNTSNGDGTICRVTLENLEHWHSKTPKSSTPWPQPARPANQSGGSTGSGGGTGTGSTGGSGNADDGVEAAKLLGWGAPQSDSDEFNYTGPPNPALWSLYDGPGHAGNGTRDPSAWNVANGILTCTGTAGGSTGGMSHSRSQQYMRVEWRVRTYSINPNGSGHRYHPVLIDWPTSDQWPQGGEFDFYECDCDSGLYEAYLHIPGNDGSAQEYVKKACDISQWHNIAFEWSKNGCAGWLDGQQVFNFPGFKQPPGPMQLTAQLDNFFGSGMEPAKFEAMWCRIYAPPGSTSSGGTTTTLARARSIRVAPSGELGQFNMSSNAYIAGFRFEPDTQISIDRFYFQINGEGASCDVGRTGYGNGNGGTWYGRIVDCDQNTGLPITSSILCSESINACTRHNSVISEFGLSGTHQLHYVQWPSTTLQPGRMYAFLLSNTNASPGTGGSASSGNHMSVNMNFGPLSQAGPNGANTLNPSVPGAMYGLGPRETVLWSATSGSTWKFGDQIGWYGNGDGNFKHWPVGYRLTGGANTPIGWPLRMWASDGSGGAITYNNIPKAVTITGAGGTNDGGGSVGVITVTNVTTGASSTTASLGSGKVSGNLNTPVTASAGDNIRIATSGRIGNGATDAGPLEVYNLGSQRPWTYTVNSGVYPPTLYLIPDPFF